MSADGKRIAAAGVGLGDDRKVFLWDVENPNPISTYTGHKDDVYRVQFSPDGNHLLSAGYAGTINIWKIGQEQPAYSHDLPIVLYSATYAPNGNQLAIASSDGKTYLINLPNTSN
jgi:WD40 repeat protein